MIIKKSFYNKDTKTVAKELLGKFLVHEIDGKKLIGRIVETEAYYGENDPASHACKGITPRNKIMFGPPGKAYVYFIYGNYYLLNIVAEKKGKAGAVLIRALEPVKNIKNTNGPGKLTREMKITREHNGLDVTKKPLYILNNKSSFDIVKTTRIGIKKGDDLLLRFYIKGNKFVSRKQCPECKT